MPITTGATHDWSWRATVPRLPRWLIVLLALCALPQTATAQQSPFESVALPEQSPPAAQADDKGDQRSLGLPGPVKWTFNFDAGWGTFGFAQFAVQQPEGSRRRGEPERSVVRGLRQAGAVRRLHARVVERDLRQGERRRRAHVRLGAGRVRRRRVVVRARGPLDRLAIGQVARRLARTRSTSRSAARRTSSVTASCCTTARPKAAAAAATGPTRARRSSSPRSAASSPAPHTVEAFYLDKDELPESDTGSRLWGVNYEIEPGTDESTTLGATYMKWFARRRTSSPDATG